MNAYPFNITPALSLKVTPALSLKVTPALSLNVTPALLLNVTLALLLTASLSACQTTSSKSTSRPTSPTSSSANQPSNQQSGETPTASSSTTVGTTAEETIDDLDAELDASMAVFDGMILEERAKAEAVAEATYNDQETADQGAGGEEALFEEGDINEGLPGYGEFPETEPDTEAQTESGTRSDAESGDAPEGEQSDEQEKATGNTSKDERAPSSSSTGGIPEDINDGGDGDIVARQIREAAMKEKDPALKEKLWDEYRKYKNQQQKP